MVWGTGTAASVEVFTQNRYDTGLEWQAAVFEELRLADVDCFLSEIDIADGQTNNLAKSQAHTIGKNHHGVEGERP